MKKIVSILIFSLAAISQIYSQEKRECFCYDPSENPKAKPLEIYWERHTKIALMKTVSVRRDSDLGHDAAAYHKIMDPYLKSAQKSFRKLQELVLKVRKTREYYPSDYDHFFELYKARFKHMYDAEIAERHFFQKIKFTYQAWRGYGVILSRYNQDIQDLQTRRQHALDSIERDQKNINELLLQIRESCSKRAHYN